MDILRCLSLQRSFQFSESVAGAAEVELGCPDDEAVSIDTSSDRGETGEPTEGDRVRESLSKS